MPKYTSTATTSKIGVDYVRSIVNASGNIFHKIEQENDLGIDAIVELIKDKRPLNCQFALQIKSGQSYFYPQSAECIIPVDDHYDYWTHNLLPVFGIVYLPAEDCGYWVDIKKHLKAQGSCSTIRFPRNEARRFDRANFLEVFVPIVIGQTPSISYERALRLFASESPDEFQLAMIVLFRKHPNRRETWDNLVSVLRTRPADSIPPILPYYLAHVPWHGDINAFGEIVTGDTRDYARDLIHKLGKDEIVKLLGLIDEENFISRGSIGQSVEALIPIIQNGDSVLADVARDSTMPVLIRECAALIYAYHCRANALSLLAELETLHSLRIEFALNSIRTYGAFDPY